MIEDIRSGRVDQLDLIRDVYRDEIPLPPGAVYDARCSASEAELFVLGTAVYTLGHDKSQTTEAAAADYAAAEAASDPMAMFQAMGNVSDAVTSGPAGEALLEAKAFYEAEGFTQISAPGVSTWVFASPDDPPGKGITVTVMESPPVLPGCEHLPTGPAIEVSLDHDSGY